MSIEMVVLTPILVGCILTIAGGSRFVEASALIHRSAGSW